jgi:dihydrolipoamide dehydrogenase
MNELKTDVAIIGAGTAGLAAYRAVLREGKQAILIEGGPYGTTCARVGCMPSKLLIAAAHAAHIAAHTQPFGIHVDGNIRVEGREVMARVKAERDRFVGFVLDNLENIPAEHKLRGYARFVGPQVLEVDAHTRVQAQAVVIASGSAGFVPPSFRELGDRLVVNDDVFEWNDLPKRVAVFGPGVIGLELGQALFRLGVDVRMFGVSGSLGSIKDPQVRQAAKKIFQKEFYLDPDARVLHTKRMGDEVEIKYIALDNTERTERFDYVLMATGRRPNLAGLDLAQAQVEVPENGVPAFNKLTMQIGALPIFIAGDVNADVPLLHEASDEGHIAGSNAANFPNVKAGQRRAPLSVVFTDPQIATVGIYPSHDQSNYVTGSLDFTNQGRSRVINENHGLLHIYAEKETGLFVGAQMVGPRAEHLGHLLAWALQQNMTVHEMLTMPFYHPVIEEGLRTALRDATRQLSS